MKSLLGQASRHAYDKISILLKEEALIHQVCSLPERAPQEAWFEFEGSPGGVGGSHVNEAHGFEPWRFAQVQVAGSFKFGA